MTLRNGPNYTGQTAYELMFGRQIRTKPGPMKACKEKYIALAILARNSKNTREFKVGERVQIRMTKLPNGNLELWPTETDSNIILLKCAVVETPHKPH